MTPDLRTRAEQLIGFRSCGYLSRAEYQRVAGAISDLLGELAAAEQRERAIEALVPQNHAGSELVTVPEYIRSLQFQLREAEQREQALREMLVKVRGALGAHWALRDEVDCTLERTR